MKSVCWSLLILSFAACSEKQTTADLIISGGKIYTLDPSNPVVEAVAVVGDTIAYSGSLEGASEWEGDKTRRVDLRGNTMTPGFIESHGHLMGLGQSEMNLELDNIRSYEELVEKVKDAARRAKPGEWIVGRGWHQDKWDSLPKNTVKGFQTHHLLSAATPDNPVYLVHSSGHAAFANAMAMQLSGVNQLAIEKISKDPGESGEVIRDALGNPTGVFVEHAKELIHSHVPVTSEEMESKALTLALGSCLRNGISSFHDAGTSSRTLSLYNKFKSEGKLTSRIYVMVESNEPAMLKEWLNRGPEIDPTHWLTIRAIKLHCDGALGSRSAWLLAPYSDRKETVGMTTLSMDSVLDISEQALRSGFQVCSHAIGDKANREVLNKYEEAFRRLPERSKDHRFRIEHAQHIDPVDIPRFAKLNVIASVQAIHLSSDRPWAIDRLGEKRIKDGAYMWQSLLKSGAKVINGTDVPVEPINPIASFYAAVSRKTLKGEPEGGYEPGEKMTREQALRAYTLDAAYASFEESIKGSIEKGKLADFTVFSQDIMEVPEEELLKTEVKMTIVGGKVVFEK